MRVSYSNKSNLINRMELFGLKLNEDYTITDIEDYLNNKETTISIDMITA